MTPEQLGAIKARIVAAQDAVRALCNGDARWTMSIPARPESDPDLVIGRALADAEVLFAEVQRLRDAILRADGQGATFEPRNANQGPYWWRRELMRRAGIKDHRAAEVPQ